MEAMGEPARKLPSPEELSGDPFRLGWRLRTDAATGEQLLTGDEEADRLRAELDRLMSPYF
jgi:hypothetical protein